MMGRFATIRDVVEHNDKFLRLSLSEAEKQISSLIYPLFREHERLRLQAR
jgi:hypothetical protein